MSSPGVALLAAGAAELGACRAEPHGPAARLRGCRLARGRRLDDARVRASRSARACRSSPIRPDARDRRALVALIALAYVDGLIPDLARAAWPTIVLMALVVAAAVLRYVAGARPRTPGARGRLRGVARDRGAPGARGGWRIWSDAGTDALAAWLYDAAIVLTAVGPRGRPPLRPIRARSRDGLVVDLGESQEPQALRAALARTVGDPSLQIAYRVDEQWVDEAGQRGAAARRRTARHAWSPWWRTRDRPSPRWCTTPPRCGTRRSRARSRRRCGWRWRTSASRSTSPPASARSRRLAVGSSRPATTNAAACATSCGAGPSRVWPPFQVTCPSSPESIGETRPRRSPHSWPSLTARASTSHGSRRACIRVP